MLLLILSLFTLMELVMEWLIAISFIKLLISMIGSQMRVLSEATETSLTINSFAL